MLKRILSAAVLIPLVIAAIFYLPVYAFAPLMALLILGAGWEMSKMFWPQQNYQQLIFLISLTLLFVGSHFIAPLWVLLLAVLFWVLVVPVLLLLYSRWDEFNPFATNLAKYLFGILVLVPCFKGFMVLWAELDKFWVLAVLLLVWAADTGAYFAGVKFGKHKLAPKLSPKKSVEGLWGGLVLALIMAVAIGWFKLHLVWHNWPIWLFLVVITVLWSVLGDLVESMVKRIAQVKDSGDIIPGHGGIYDRIDSLTAAAPLFALGLVLLGM